MNRTQLIIIASIILVVIIIIVVVVATRKSSSGSSGYPLWYKTTRATTPVDYDSSWVWADGTYPINFVSLPNIQNIVKQYGQRFGRTFNYFTITTAESRSPVQPPGVAPNLAGYYIAFGSNLPKGLSPGVFITFSPASGSYSIVPNSNNLAVGCKPDSNAMCNSVNCGVSVGGMTGTTWALYPA